MSLTFSLRRSVVMTNALAKNHGERSFGSKASVETDGRTDTTDRIAFRANAAGDCYVFRVS